MYLRHGTPSPVQSLLALNVCTSQTVHTCNSRNIFATLHAAVSPHLPALGLETGVACLQAYVFAIWTIPPYSGRSVGLQEQKPDRRQQDSALRGSIGQPAKAFAAADADISSDETHPQLPLKAEVANVPAFEAPAKSGGSELFDALLMAATGMRESLLPCTGLWLHSPWLLKYIIALHCMALHGVVSRLQAFTIHVFIALIALTAAML